MESTLASLLGKAVGWGEMWRVDLGEEWSVTIVQLPGRVWLFATPRTAALYLPLHYHYLLGLRSQVWQDLSLQGLQGEGESWYVNRRD